MSDDVESLFREVAVLQSLTEEDRDRLLRCSYIQAFPPETTLFTEGHEVSFVLVLLAGEVELGACLSERCYTMMVKGPGAVFPLESCVDSGTSSYTARTLQRCRILMIPVAFLRDLIQRNPDVTRAFLAHAAKVNRHLTMELHDQQLRSPLERLANWIWRQSADGEDVQTLRLMVPKRMLASSLGMSLTTLGREIDALKRYGVEFQDRTIRVRSVKDLAQLANPTPHLLF
jgi:CRP/FNR family transcriptional regulator, transcriptional activator FtrB